MKRNKTYYIFITIPIYIILLIINYALFVSNGIVVAHPDFLAVLDWAYSSHKNGLISGFGNYMPFWPYFAIMYSWLVPSLKSNEYAYLLKGIIILIDSISFVIILYVSEKILNRRQIIFYSILILSNLSLYYNSIFWGQIDNIHTLFIGLSLLSLVRESYFLSGFFIVFGILTKIVAIIFLPLIILILISLFFHQYDFKIILRFLFGCFLGIFILSFPLLVSGNLVEYIMVQSNNILNYDCISGNAFNIWYIITFEHDNLITNSDLNLFFRDISFKTFGRGLFLIFYSIAFIPLFLSFVSRLIKNNFPLSINLILLVSILIPLLFFYFLTNIRERYCHPYIFFLTIYCFTNKKYILWYLASIPYFLQLEAVLKFTVTIHPFFSKLHSETHLFNPIFISAVFLVMIIYFLSTLYKEYFSLERHHP